MSNDDAPDHHGDPERAANSGNEKKSQSKPPLAPYVFTAKIVVGTGLIFIAAAASTLLAMTVSQSPQIHIPLDTTTFLSTTGPAGFIGPANDNAALASQSSMSQNVDKRFVLVQHDFGWNGTTGGPTITVKKGDVVQIVVLNAGKMSHNFGIGKPSAETMQIMKVIDNMSLPDRMRYIEYETLAQMPCPDCHPKFEKGHIKPFVKPEEQTITTFTASEAGHFKYFCMVRGHIWLGMHGDFIVQDTNSTGRNSDSSSSASNNMDDGGGAMG